VRASLTAFRQVFSNRDLRRLQLAWAGSNIGGWAYTVAIAVYAYQQDGAYAVGLIGLARWIAAGAASPFTGALGVLSVLDRPKETRFTLAEMDLLSRFANQAAIGLDLLLRARRARAALEGADEGLQRLAHLGRNLEALPPERRPPALRLLAALEEIIRP